MLVAAAVGFLAMAGAAVADVTTEQPGSIVIWPKVVWDGSRDTIIEFTNTGPFMVHARCFYINGAGGGCSETDFDVWLTRQQPTHWVASQGRTTGWMDPFGSDGAGIDPGHIPPVPLGFTGELKCIEVDDQGLPMSTNKFKGEATLRDVSGDVSRYNAIAIQGNPGFASNDILANDQLDLNLTNNNPGGEYNACPDTLLLNHFAEGYPDPVAADFGVNASISTTVTLVPCSEDLENQVPSRITVQFQIFNEFEQPFSASTTVGCWLNRSLTELGSLALRPFSFSTLGSPSAYTRINPNPGQGGVIGVAEETRDGATAAYNISIEGNRFDAATDGKGHPVDGVEDRIKIPVW